MTDLLAGLEPRVERLADGAVLLRGFASEGAADLLRAVGAVAAVAPFRHMVMRTGAAMSVAMTSCGRLGWVADRSGYRYDASDPATGLPWPPFPAPFLPLARTAAEAAGFPDFRPDSCLVNRYAPGARMGLHQDRDESDLAAPIVSVSLGVPATFLFGGLDRAARPSRHRLRHGDVVVWGGPARLAFHGVAPLAAADHADTGALRYNLTFRRIVSRRG